MPRVVKWTSLVGTVIGKWAVGGKADTIGARGHTAVRLHCLCECGTYDRIRTTSLLNNQSRGCRLCAVAVARSHRRHTSKAPVRKSRSG